MNQLKTGAILNYIVLGLNSLVGILYTPFLLRMLGQSEYGIYSLATSVIAYLGIMDLGFGNAIIRYVAKYRGEKNKEKEEGLLGMFSLIYIFIGIITLIVGSIFSYNCDGFFDKNLNDYEIYQIKIILYLLTFNLSFTFLFNVYNSAITAYEDFIYQKIVQILRIILNTVVMIALLEWGYKAVALVVCQTVFNIITQILNYYYFRFKLRIVIKFGYFDKGLFFEVCKYSIWIFIATIIDRLYWSTGPFILGAEIGAIAVAVFSVAMSLEHIFLSFSTAISGVFLPRISKMVAINSGDTQISDLFIKTGRIQFIIIFLFLSAFLIFGKDFLNLWAGHGYKDSYLSAVYLFLGLLIPAIQNTGIAILQARNNLKFRALSLLCISLGCIVGQIFLSRHYGAIGCAFAIFITLLLGQGVVMNYYYWKKQHIDILKFWKQIIRMSFAPIILTVTYWFFFQQLPIVNSWMPLLSYGSIFLILYIIIAFRFVFNSYETDLFLSPLKKLINR